MAVGEVGTLTRGGFGADEEVRVEFTEEISDAVIMLTATNNGGDEFSLIVTSVDDTGFTFRLSEFEDRDGPHPATETINWIAVTPGVHALPDGRIIEAGTTVAGTEESEVSLNGDFADPPVVLTNRMSENDPDVADSDPFEITEDGFKVSLQEGSLSDGENTGETVGYIAISQGGDSESGTAVTYDNLDTGVGTYDLGDTFQNGITLAETQTLNEGDAGNVHLRNDDSDSEARAFFDEERGDGQTSHATESVGFITFEAGIIPCFVAGTLIDTPQGPRDVADLHNGDMVLTRDHGPQELLWVCHNRVALEGTPMGQDLQPIMIRAGAIAPGVPSADLVVSPQHRMLISGWKAELFASQSEVLVPAKALVNDASIVELHQAQVDYYHLLFARHEVVYANGAPSESLYASDLSAPQLSAAHRQELSTVFPDLDLGFGKTARACLTVRQGLAFRPNGLQSI